MAEYTLNSTRLTEAMARLRSFANGTYMQAIQAGGDRAGVKLDELARTALPPSTQSSKPSPLRTKKQIRWWWATMHAKAKGKSRALPGWKAVYKKVNGRKVLIISGGYRRTGKLVQSLTWETRTISRGVEVRYGTNRAYAPYVIGDPDDPNKDKRQAQIHQGNWTPLHQIALQNLDALADEFIAGSTAEARRLLGGG